MVNVPKRTFRHFRLTDTANRQSGQPNDVIMRMKARAAWNQSESQHVGHCAAGDPKWSFRLVLATGPGNLPVVRVWTG